MHIDSGISIVLFVTLLVPTASILPSVSVCFPSAVLTVPVLCLILDVANFCPCLLSMCSVAPVSHSRLIIAASTAVRAVPARALPAVSRRVSSASAYGAARPVRFAFAPSASRAFATSFRVVSIAVPAFCIALGLHFGLSGFGLLLADAQRDAVRGFDAPDVRLRDLVELDLAPWRRGRCLRRC